MQIRRSTVVPSQKYRTRGPFKPSPTPPILPKNADSQPSLPDEQTGHGSGFRVLYPLAVHTVKRSDFR